MNKKGKLICIKQCSNCGKGEKNNIFPQNIWKACQKENGIAGGYIWKYNK